MRIEVGGLILPPAENEEPDSFRLRGGYDVRVEWETLTEDGSVRRPRIWIAADRATDSDQVRRQLRQAGERYLLARSIATGAPSSVEWDRTVVDGRRGWAVSLGGPRFVRTRAGRLTGYHRLASGIWRRREVKLAADRCRRSWESWHAGDPEAALALAYLSAETLVETIMVRQPSRPRTIVDQWALAASLLGQRIEFGTAMYYCTQYGRHHDPDKARRWVANNPTEALEKYECVRRASEWIERYIDAVRAGII